MSDHKRDYTKYCFLPMENPKLLEYYTKQRDAFWTVAEIDFSKDRQDWLALKTGEREFLTFVLAFFAQADGLVIENLFENFQRETSEIKEANAFYSIQNAIETIHNETYSTMIETFIQDYGQRQKAFNAIENYPSIEKIADWITKWMDPQLPLLERIVAFACVEGIFFSGAFCAIYWIKKSNRLRGLCKANEFIARDEGIHTQFAIALYHFYTAVKGWEPLTQKRLAEIIGSAIDIIEEFIRQALRVELIGMNADDMMKYVKCTANVLMTSLGYEKLYDVENPFDWMLLITLPNKTNFFEDTVSEYSKVTVNDFEFTTTANY